MYCAAVRVRLLVLTAVALLAAQAWRSDGYYFPDEWFQVVELASYKLGRTPASDLPWEFREGMRPFLQPAIYFAFANIVLRGILL